VYASPDIIIVMMLRRMRWEEHAVSMGEMRNAYKILNWKPEGKRNHSVNLSVDGLKILEWILEKQVGKNVYRIHLAQFRDGVTCLKNT